MVWGLRKKPRVLATKKPKMSDHRGRTWDSHIDVVLPDGKITKGYLDTTWGVYVYFYAFGRWWKIDNMALEGRWDNRLDLRKLWKPRRR